jgi:putative adenylate-forming enzyme
MESPQMVSERNAVSEATTRYWNWLSGMTELWMTRGAGIPQVMSVEHRRFDELVRHACRHSSFYRETYGRLRKGPIPIAELPVVTKQQLMARFDEWVTDREITRPSLTAFLENRNNIGERYLDRYCVWKSSGTSGEPGIFVQDAGALAVYDALVSAQLNTPALAGRYAWGLYAEGGRAALITAKNDHYASIATWRRAFAANSLLPARALSVTDPVSRLVEELNEFQPALLASYPTMLALLAAEQKSGRLRIAPATLWAGGERLSPPTQRRIEESFGAPVQIEYGASEALSIGYGCREGWIHVNADWVVLEPVDAHGHPTPPGELSHTTLLTNLANRVQPIIRYDLGDRILVKPAPCACGNPLPAIQVEGRTDDVLTFRLPAGGSATVLPMAIATVIEEAADVHYFQVAQVAPLRLVVRLKIADPWQRELAWSRIFVALHAFFVDQNIPGVEIALDDCEPALCEHSGKLRAVVDES